MKRTANMMIRKLFSSVRFDMLWKESWQLQPGGQEWPAPGSISEVLVDHRHGHLLMYFTFAILCATTGNLRSYNRHRTANKAGSLLTPALRRQKTNHRAQWCKDNTSQSGEASRGWKGRGVHRGDGERKGWVRQVCRGGRGAAQESDGQLGHLRGRSGLRRQNIPSLEIIARNLQTWMQVLMCIKQLLKTMFSSVCPDGPESPERRC